MLGGSQYCFGGDDDCPWLKALHHNKNFATDPRLKTKKTSHTLYSNVLDITYFYFCQVTKLSYPHILRKFGDFAINISKTGTRIIRIENQKRNNMKPSPSPKLMILASMTRGRENQWDRRIPFSHNHTNIKQIKENLSGFQCNL